MPPETKREIMKIESNNLYGFSALYIQADKISIALIAEYAHKLNLELLNQSKDAANNPTKVD